MLSHSEGVFCFRNLFHKYPVSGLIRLVNDFGDLLQILAHAAALCSQGLLDLADALDLIGRQFADSSEDQLFRGAVSFLADFEARIGAECIASDDEHIDTSDRLAGVFTRCILRSPVRNLRIEVRNRILEHADEIGSPGRIGTSATQEDAVGVELRVVIDLHSKTFPPFRTWQIHYPFKNKLLCRVIPTSLIIIPHFM